MPTTTFIPPYIDQNLEDQRQIKLTPSMIIAAGNSVLLLSVLGLIASIIIAYTHAEHFSLNTQIAAHIGMMFMAGTLKLGYIVRLNGSRIHKLSKGKF